MASPVLSALRVSQDRSHPPSTKKNHPSLPVSRPLVIGFVPMIDCAALIVAQELGLFVKHGLRVTLSREVGWATVRDKLLHEELHAAHAPASLAFVIQCGLGIVARPCLTGFVMGANGSAITVSRELWEKGVRDAATLRTVIEKDRANRVFRFGAVHEFSSQNYDLRRWLRSGGLDPDRDVQIPIVAPPVIHRGLLDGHLDGYCVAEPWNTVSVESGDGRVVATSSHLAPGRPEKVLLVLQKFADEYLEEHLGLIAALIEASEFCEDPANRPALVRMLARPAYLDLPEAILAPSLIGPFPLGSGAAEKRFIAFGGGDVNVPDRAKGRRIYEEVRQLPGAQSCRSLRPDSIGRTFREDLYRAAAKRVHRPAADVSPVPRDLPRSSVLALAL
jgi:ABC-type nitrate/sulfonate/bicarbonate transport system substrate-binding protein